MTTAFLLCSWKSKGLLALLDSAIYIKLFPLPGNFFVGCAGLYHLIYKESPTLDSSEVIW